PATERLRAESDWAQRQIERRQAEADLASARAALALTWGGSEARFDSLALADPSSAPPPPRDSLLARLGRPPAVRRPAARSTGAEAKLAAARASHFPDLDVLGGVRHLNEVGKTGFLVGISAPIPVWNSGVARIGAAEADRNAAIARARVVRFGLERDLAGAWE